MNAPAATAPPAAPAGRRLVAPLTRSSVELPLALALAVLVAAFCVAYPHQFATVGNFRDMARVGAILLVVAIGQMLALLVGGFDLSVGANMGFASTVGALVMRDHTMWPGIAAALAAAAAVGLVNGILIAYVNVSPFIATLGTLTFITGYGNQISGGTSVGPLPPAFGWFGARDWGPIPATVCIAAVAAAALTLLLNWTRLGLYIYSIGASRPASVLAGVPVRRYEVSTYTICGLLAGVAGLMLSSRVSVGQATIGDGYELTSIATAVIGGVAIGGGVGRLRGVLIGVAILAVLTTGLDIAGLSQFAQSMVTGAVLVVAVAADNLRHANLARVRALLRGRRMQYPV